MSTKEIWKPIEQTEGLYQISNLGRVKSMPRFHKTKDTGYYSKEKILKPTKDTCGYLHISLRKPNGFNTRNGYKTMRIHILVAQAFIDNPNNLKEVNHLDGDKTNNKVENLEWCSHEDNIKHAFYNGLNSKSKRNQYKKKCNLASKYIKNHERKGCLELNEWQTFELLEMLEVE